MRLQKVGVAGEYDRCQVRQVHEKSIGYVASIVASNLH